MDQSLSAPLSQKEKWSQVLSQPRLLSIIFLGFASGLPLLLSGSTLQAWYAVSHVNIVTIGLLTLVGQPYVYKFLWAPFLDRYDLPFLGRRRGWIFLLQVLLVISIAAMAFLKPDSDPWGLAMLAIMVSFLSATQDIAIDAYRTEILFANERGLGAGLNTIGYRASMVIAGALALVFADHFGWKLTYLCMSFLMALQLIVTYFSKNTLETSCVAPLNLLQAIAGPFQSFFKEKYAISVLIFIILYKLGDVFTLIFGTTFLIRGVGFSLTDIGLIYKLVGMFGILLGVMVGGLWMRKISLLRSLAIFGVVQALTNLPFMWLALCGKNYIVLVIAILVENFGSGLGSVALLAFIMSLCDHRFTATHFALFSALAAIGRVFVGPLAGLMVEQLGWAQFYFWACMIGFPGVLMLFLIKKHKVFSDYLNK